MLITWHVLFLYFFLCILFEFLGSNDILWLVLIFMRHKLGTNIVLFFFRDNGKLFLDYSWFVFWFCHANDFLMLKMYKIRVINYNLRFISLLMWLIQCCLPSSIVCFPWYHDWSHQIGLSSCKFYIWDGIPKGKLLWWLFDY